MARNIEIKARANDFATQLETARQLSDQPLVTLVQWDTFFSVSKGRLKLREFGNTETPNKAAELIFYHRPDTDGPKLSDYHITRTDDAEGLKAVLAKAYGVQQEVRKVRQLYMAGRTRLHFDSVENLGDFIELEVVLADSDSLEQGQAEAETLMRKLNIDQQDLVEVAYADLLAQALPTEA